VNVTAIGAEHDERGDTRRPVRVTMRCALAALVVSAVGALAPVAAATAATAHRASASVTPPSVDWGAGMTFGAVGNVGPGAVADCAIAAVADIEQVLARSSAPPDPSPYLAAYDALVRAAGGVPGPQAGLAPSSVLSAWQGRGIAGTRARTARLASVGRGAVEAALASGPLYAVLDLPTPASTAPTWVSANDVAVTAWTPAAPPAGYEGGGAHVVALTGYDSSGVLVATWGFVQPVSWAEWAMMASAAWSITS